MFKIRALYVQSEQGRGLLMTCVELAKADKLQSRVVTYSVKITFLICARNLERSASLKRPSS